MTIKLRHINWILATIALLGIFWRAGTWIYKTKFIDEANAERIAKVEIKQENREKQDEEHWVETNRRLSHMEGILEEMRRQY
jgi:hypothetical protein